MLLAGEEIFALIPQRPPMTMVDALYDISSDGARTGLLVTSDNVFNIGGQFIEPGIVEHVAQSAAVMAGYPRWKAGLPPKEGLIGEVKSFVFNKIPKVGDNLVTSISVVASVGGVTLVNAIVTVADTEIARGTIKIFIEE